MDLRQGRNSLSGQGASGKPLTDNQIEWVVHFEVAMADAYEKHDYDLICFFDCLHDMGRSVHAIRYSANAKARDGTLMLMELFPWSRTSVGRPPVLRRFHYDVLRSRHIGEWQSRTRRAGGLRHLEDMLKEAGLGWMRRAVETWQLWLLTSTLRPPRPPATVTVARRRG
jgi:hypothetical protein